MSAKILTLNSHNFRDAPSTLRHLAEEIEKGEHGELRMVALAMLHSEDGEPKLTTFGCGPEAEGHLASLVFYEGFEVTRKMVMGS